jgi:prepilin-type N-terminal cleavage/methylation domain-containing protein
MKRQHGFTLVELAVALMIVALLLGMFVVPLGTQMDNQRIAETQKQLELARDAVLGFAVARGRLPCPATRNTPIGTAGAGTENKPGAACGLTEGVLPWADLGVAETDAWGRRFTYRITPMFADDPPAGMQATFLIGDNGTISVTNGAANIALNLPAVIVSHGKNGSGGFKPDGTQMPAAAGDEAENTNGNDTFVSRTFAADFDDVLLWVSGNVLKTRMVAAGRYP